MENLKKHYLKKLKELRIREEIFQYNDTALKTGNALKTETALKCHKAMKEEIERRKKLITNLSEQIEKSKPNE